MTLRLVHPAPADDMPVLVYEHRACHVCGATTNAEASKACVVASDASGASWCAGAARPESGPGGILLFPTAASIVALEAWIDAEITREMERALP